MMVVFIHCIQFANILLKIFLSYVHEGNIALEFFFGMSLSCFNVTAMLPSLKMTREVFSIFWKSNIGIISLLDI